MTTKADLWQEAAHAATAECRRLRELLTGLVEGRDIPCEFDHNGHCQEHGWFGKPGECYVHLARVAVGLEGPDGS